MQFHTIMGGKVNAKHLWYQKIGSGWNHLLFDTKDPNQIVGILGTSNYLREEFAHHQESFSDLGWNPPHIISSNRFWAEMAKAFVIEPTLSASKNACRHLTAEVKNHESATCNTCGAVPPRLVVGNLHMRLVEINEVMWEKEFREKTGNSSPSAPSPVESDENGAEVEPEV